MVQGHPDCIRALYGLSDTRNACHGSDSIESVIKEIQIFFPEFNFNGAAPSTHASDDN